MRIESLSSVGSKQINEDTSFIGDDLVAVFDGASPLIKGGPIIDGRTGGQIASKTARQVFAENQDSDISLEDLLVAANDDVRQAQERAGVNYMDAGKAWGTTISAARFSDGYVEWASVGDSPVLVKYRDSDDTELVAGQDDWDTESLNLWKSLVVQGVEDPRHDSRMESQLLKVRRQANLKYGYCNGNPAMESFIRLGGLPVKEVGSLILMTDGFMLPKENPGDADDWAQFARLYSLGGLRNVLKNIRDAEKQDRNCRKWLRFKTHDDATAIAVDLPKR